MSQWNPPFESWVYVAVIAACAIMLPAMIFRSRAITSKPLRVLLFCIRAIVIAILVLILIDPVIMQVASNQAETRRQVFLVDTSESMTLNAPTSRARLARSIYEPIITSPKYIDQVSVYGFDGILHTANKQQTLPPNRGLSTQLGSALYELLYLTRGADVSDVVVFSDGRIHDRQLLPKAVAQARRLGCPVSTCTLGEPVQLINLSIENCSVKRHAPPDAKLPLKISVRARGIDGQRCELYLGNQEKKVIGKLPFTAKEGLNELEMTLDVGKRSGKYTLLLSLMDGEITADDNLYEFSVVVNSNKIKVLYMEGTTGSSSTWNIREYEFLERALEETGEIDVTVLIVNTQRTKGGRIYQVDNPRLSYPTTRKELLEYDVIICSDINRYILSSDQMRWTVELVAERGGGFCMVGGRTSFNAGGYDRTIWEQMIPVDMASAGRGLVWEIFKPYFPRGARDHPILRMDSDEDKNNRILDAIPSFMGTNLVRRAKPAATVLAIHPRRQMPIICVQQYGKGRSMAFLSDTTSTWGRYFEAMWGVELKDYPSALPPGRKPTSKYIPYPPKCDNSYFKRFWVNTIRWLAENSQAHRKERLLGNTERITYRPGEAINLRAGVLDVKGENSRDLRVEARLQGVTSSETILAWDDERSEYTGSLTLPEDTTSKEATVVFRTTVEGGLTLSDEISIHILQLRKEFDNPQPDEKLMGELARSTGGEIIQSRRDLTKLLDRRVIKDKEPQTYPIPLWDTMWLWSLLVFLLSVDWFIRRMARN
jgi:uncharacterized membrane protein